MLYYLSEFEELFSPFRVFQYITVRAVGGAGTAFVLSLILGPWVIKMLHKFKISQYIRKEEAPPLYVLHAQKE